MKFKSLCSMALVLGIGLSGGANAAPVLWVGDSDGTLGTVDVATGTVNVIGQMGAVMTDIAFDSSGNLYGISFDNLYSIDSTNAATTLIGQHSLGTGTKNSLVFGADGTLYAANTALYTLDLMSGASSMVGTGGDPYSSSGDLAFIGGNLYLSSTSATAGTDKLVQLDTSTGMGSDVGNIGYSVVYGLATDNNIDLYGLSGNNVLGINTMTGAGTVLTTYADPLLGTAWGSAFYSESGASVPEPATLALLGIGLVGVGFGRRRNVA